MAADNFKTRSNDTGIFNNGQSRRATLYIRDEAVIVTGNQLNIGILGSTGILVNELLVTTVSPHGFAVSEFIYNNAGVYTKAIATSNAAANVVGCVVDVIDANTFMFQQGGFANIALWAQESGFAVLDGFSQYFLSDTVAGAITKTEPNAPNFSKGLVQSHGSTIGNIRVDLGVVGPVP